MAHLKKKELNSTSLAKKLLQSNQTEGEPF